MPDGTVSCHMQEPFQRSKCEDHAVVDQCSGMACSAWNSNRCLTSMASRRASSKCRRCERMGAKPAAAADRDVGTQQYKYRRRFPHLHRIETLVQRAEGVNGHCAYLCYRPGGDEDRAAVPQRSQYEVGIEREVRKHPLHAAVVLEKRMSTDQVCVLMLRSLEFLLPGERGSRQRGKYRPRSQNTTTTSSMASRIRCRVC